MYAVCMYAVGYHVKISGEFHNMVYNEHDLMNDIKHTLERLGYIVFRANVGKVRMADGRFFTTGLPKGFSDLFACKDGKTYFIEVKIGKNKPTPEQREFIDMMTHAGFTATAFMRVYMLQCR